MYFYCLTAPPCGLQAVPVAKEYQMWSDVMIITGSLESAYSLIWVSHKIWGKGGGDSLALLWQVGLFNKAVIGGNLAFGIGWWGANQSGSSSGNSCGKILWENLAGKSQFKKGSDWWKFSIRNRVMGSQPIRIQLGKILRENLAGKSCWKILWENLAWKGGGEKINLRKAVIGGNLAFGIGWWGANQSGSSLGKSCRKILWEIVAGNCYRKILWENLAEILAGNSYRKILWEILVGNCCGKLLQENLVGKSCRNSCRKFLQENLVGNYCGKILQENHAGKSCGKSCRKCCWKFCGKSCRKSCGKSYGKSCGKFLWDILAGRSCRKFLWEILQEILAGNSYRKILQEILVGNSVGNLVGNSAGNSVGNLVGNAMGHSLYLSPSCFWK